MDFPDRILGLIAKLEAGNPVSQEDLDRVATLQALDCAHIAQQFAQDYIAAEKQLSGDFKALVDSF